MLQSARFSEASEVGGSEYIQEAIDNAEQEVQRDFGYPFKKSCFILDNRNTQYEFRNDNEETFAIESVLIRGTDNSLRQYSEDTSASESTQKYTKNFDNNSITFHSDTASTWSGFKVEILYVPMIFHWLVRLKAALYIKEEIAATKGDEVEHVVVQRMRARIERYETTLSPNEAYGSYENQGFNKADGEWIEQIRFKVF